MKSIKEIRLNYEFNPQEVTFRLKYFLNQNIDWNVYLKSKDRFLQRDFVWTIEQKRELINSVLIGRHIPHCAIVNIVDPADKRKEIFQIIDGKQRLSTLISFYLNEFTIVIDGDEYYFKDLPNDYQLVISGFYFRCYIINEPFDNPMTDEQKINWFKFINFAGTPQDNDHIRSLS